MITQVKTIQDKTSYASSILANLIINLSIFDDCKKEDIKEKVEEANIQLCEINSIVIPTLNEDLKKKDRMYLIESSDGDKYTYSYSSIIANFIFVPDAQEELTNIYDLEINDNYYSGDIHQGAKFTRLS